MPPCGWLHPAIGLAWQPVERRPALLTKLGSSGAGCFAALLHLVFFSLPGPTSFLCSRECQKRDYPSHKAECKRLRAQKAAAAAAQAGDGEASGTKAGGGGGGTGKHAADD